MQSPSRNDAIAPSAALSTRYHFLADTAAGLRHSDGKNACARNTILYAGMFIMVSLSHARTYDDEQTSYTRETDHHNNNNHHHHHLYLFRKHNKCHPINCQNYPEFLQLK